MFFDPITLPCETQHSRFASEQQLELIHCHCCSVRCMYVCYVL